MARNPISQARNTASARTSPTYPRNPMEAVYIPGAKSIEGATGDITVTTDNWIENEKYHWYYDLEATSGCSAEFDTAVTRTGAKTIKLFTTSAIGKGTINNKSSPTLAELKNHTAIIKPSTAYVFTCYIKTTTVATNSAVIRLVQCDSAGVIGTLTNSTLYSGTNDWTPVTISFTSDNDACFLRIDLRLVVVSQDQFAWFDVNSMTLVETGVTRNPVI